MAKILEYVEVFKGRMVAPIAPRGDKKVPQFAGERLAVDITKESPKPQPGWLWDGNTWTESTFPPPAPRQPSQLDRIEAKLDQLLTPGPP